MATSAQIRGMLLEEALLYLLRKSGYKTVTNAGNDPTLQDGHAGLEVKGRGTNHQIDAIADFMVSPPFSYPQRLLVEAKCYSPGKSVGIDVIRNAVGVRKDIEEYWATTPKDHRISLKQRYHYQYGVFSASSYSSGAISYAFAHDIYLLPLENSHYVSPIIDSIHQFTNEVTSTIITRSWSLHQIRQDVRDTLLHNDQSLLDWQMGSDGIGIGDNVLNLLSQFIGACRQIDEAALAMLGGRFPVFLVPAPEITLSNLGESRQVRIFWDDHGWYIRSSQDNEFLFSFDLPDELFQLYEKSGRLTASQALVLKQQYLSEIQLFVSDGDRLRLVTLSLDMDWIDQIKVKKGYQTSFNDDLGF